MPVGWNYIGVFVWMGDVLGYDGAGLWPDDSGMAAPARLRRAGASLYSRNHARRCSARRWCPPGLGTFRNRGFNEEKLIAETLRCVRESLAALRERGWQTDLIQSRIFMESEP